MKRTWILVLILAVAAQLAFAGGSKEAKESGPKQVKITYVTFLNPSDNAPRSVAQNQILDNFKKANPNIDVEVQVLGWADIAPRLIQAVAAGNPPDVTRVASDSLAQQYAAKTLQSLDAFVDKMPNAAAYKEDWVLPWTLGTDRGVKRSVWIDHRAVILYYNKKHLAEIGLSEPPKSWNEIGQVAQKLTAKGYSGLAVGLASSGAGNGLVEWLKPAIWSYGGDLLDADGKAAFNGEAGQKAFQLLSDLAKSKAITPEILTTDVDGMFQGFQAGRVSMLSFANHRFTTAQKTLGAENIGYIPMPSVDGAKPAQAHITGWMLGLPVGAKNPDASWKLIQHITSSESNVINAKIGGELATRKSAFNDGWFQNDPVGKAMIDWKNYILNFGRFPQFPADYLFLHQILCEAAQQIVQQNRPIKETLDAAALKYNTQKQK